MRRKECFYKGYRTLIEYISDDDRYFGKIEGIEEYIYFEALTMIEAEEAFHRLVDKYISNKIN